MIKNIDGKEYFGKHLVLDVYGCSDDIHSIEFWENWIPLLVNLIDMKAYGPLIIEKFGEGELHGISAMQFIETSSIVLHNEKRNNGIHLDVFSCADFDEYEVYNYVQKTLHPNMNTARYKIVFR